MPFEVIKKEKYFINLGWFEYLFKLTFFNKETQKWTYAYLLESEFLEDPYLFTSDLSFDAKQYKDDKTLSDEFQKFVKTLVKWDKSEVKNIDQTSVLYYIFSEIINFEEESNTGCMPLYMKIQKGIHIF